MESYVFDVRYKIKVDLDSIPPLSVTPSNEPTEVVVKADVGYRVGRTDRLGPGEEFYSAAVNPQLRHARLRVEIMDLRRLLHLPQKMTCSTLASYAADKVPTPINRSWQFLRRPDLF